MLAWLLLLFLVEDSSWDQQGTYTLTFENVLTYQTEEWGTIVGTTAYKGRLYILDRASHCVHMMNPNTGAYIGRFGRKGQGPGEFEFTFTPRLERSDEEIIIIDGDKINHFTLDGTYKARQLLPSRFGNIRRSTLLPNGSFLMLAATHLQESGKNRDCILLWNPHDDSVNELAQKEGNRYRWIHTCYHIQAYPDEFTFFLVDDASTIAYASFHDRTIHLLDLNGNKKGQVIIPWDSYPITDEEKEKQLAFMNGRLQPSNQCRKYVAESEPVYLAIMPFEQYFLVGQFRSYDGLFNVRVLTRSGDVLGTGRYSFGAHGQFSRGDDGHFYATGVNDAGDWQITRLRVTLATR